MSNKGAVKNSIRTRLVALIFMLIALVIVFCWLMNTLFLERIYLWEKEKAIKSGFNTLEAAAADGTLYEDDYDTKLESVMSAEGLTCLILSSDGSEIMSNAGSSRFMVDQLYRSLFMRDPHGVTLDKGENYAIERRSDNASGSEYLLLWGILSDGNVVLIRAAVESIKDSAKVSNMMLLVAGVVALVIGLAAAFVASGYFTGPIRRLTALSEQMAGLDFNARYEPREKPDEIDILGVSMNRLSERLEDTIHDLKNANMELERDIRLRDENDAMRQDFIAGVSHELKTPLALIGGYAEGLKDAVNDDEESRRYYCDVIIDETGKMSRMVKELLTLNQLEYGKGSVEMYRFDIVPVIDGVIRANKGLTDEAGIRVSLSLPEGSRMGNGLDVRTAGVDTDIAAGDGVMERCDVWGDELLAEQIITNYFTNAIHYCEGKKEIRVSLKYIGDSVRFAVYNTGNPIPEESLPHIWEKFYKADKARSRSYGGSGIGLSIVKAAAETLGKECGVHNEEEGVTFWFDFSRS